MRKYSIFVSLVLLFFGLSFFALNSRVSAQENTNDAAKKYGVSFPIGDLGGCKDYYECRNYCEDPLHYDTCVSFAKSKGFYKDVQIEGDEKLLTKAKSNLGCSTRASCREFCEKQENFDKCHKFAQNTGVVGGYKEDPTSKALISQAKDFLSCNTYESCRSFCENPANRDKCAEFARKIGINGGYEYKGPGGCSSAETCQAFCTNPSNVEICKQYSSGYGGKFVGPGGCTDEASCRSYCEKNPQSCSISGSEKGYDPQIMCKKTPSCKWEDNTCKCGFYENADKNYDPAVKCKEYGCSWSGNYCACSTSDNAYQERQKASCLQYPSCAWTGSYCSCSQTNINYSADPATSCTKYSGCTWSGTSCQCSGSTYYTGNTMTKDQQEATCKAGGGTCQWNNDICSCQGYQSTTTSGSTYTPYPGSSATPYSTYYPTSYTATPMATSTPVTATATPSSSTGTSDGSFCNDSDGGNYDSAGTCTDATGTHSDYCDGDTVRDWYCGGTWNGSSWSNRHCETGGFVCTSSGKQCSGGGCVSVQGAKTESLLQSILDILGL